MGSNSRPFDIKGLFKLARVTGEHPSNVLRAAGKGDLADLIEEHFGEPRPMPPLPTYSPSLKIAIQLWERIEAHGPEGQRLLNIVTDLLREADRTLALQRRLSLPKSNGNLRPARARRA
ncbi:MAG TPA: hypothetical protein VKD72_10290 [Gemmataceae bacterium]|nr:hypothetical protein [Gemmataceae bacterium]